jgi:hypothetical protein
VRSDVDRASSHEQHKQHSSPLEAEVRNELDSLMGP